MGTRTLVWVGAIATMIASGCSGQVEPGAPGEVKDPTLFASTGGGCSYPYGCNTGNGTGVYFEEGGSAGIDTIQLMITKFINNGTNVTWMGRYYNATYNMWYWLPYQGRVNRAWYNGVQYKVLAINEYSGYPTYPTVTLQDYYNDAPFTVYGYNFDALQLDISISSPIDGNWRLSFYPSSWTTDNYAQSSITSQTSKPYVYKWDMYVQNLKTLAPAVPYCKRAQQPDGSQPDDYVVFQQGINVDPTSGSVTVPNSTDVTLSCRYGAVATAYLWGYNYHSDLWHYASAIHMKRASYCGDSSYYTVSGTLIQMADEAGIQSQQSAQIQDGNIEAFWTPTGAGCYEQPRRSNLYSTYGIKPFDGNCANHTVPKCDTIQTAPYFSDVGTALWYANATSTHALVDGIVYPQ